MATQVIDAERASQMVNRYVRSMNAGRIIPKLPARIQAIADEETVHIFNVGPWAHQVSMGSLGMFTIPACPQGQKFAAMRPLPGIIAEPVPVDEKHMELHQEEGRYVADQIVGIGMMRSPSESLIPYGVFVAAGKEPTPAELTAANKKLYEYFEELIREARTAYAAGPKDAEQTITPTRHHLAARAMKLTNEPWMIQANPETRQECPSCGTNCRAGIVMCPNCKYVLDEAKYAKMKGRFAE